MSELGFYSKREFYAASRRGLLGNTLVQWAYPDFREMYRSGSDLPVRVSLRCARAAADKRAQVYRIGATEMITRCEDLLRSGYSSSELLVDESAPDEFVTLQAEAMNTERFIYLRYALNSGLGMRAAYGRMLHADGLRAVMLLRQYLDPSSQDDLFSMLSQYPSSVVELSAYPFGVGRLKRNTLFWEVRTGY